MTSALQYQLRHRMQDKGLSANALEKRAGLKPSAVQNILQGKSTRPTGLLLQAIANELECSVSDLLGDVSAASPVVNTVGSPPKKNKPWNSKMFVESIQLVEELLAKHHLAATKEIVLKYADEIYRYSSEVDRDQLDHRFADWLIEHNSQKISRA